MTYKNVLIQIFACSYDIPQRFYKVNQKKESSVDLSIFFLFFLQDGSDEDTESCVSFTR